MKIKNEKRTFAAFEAAEIKAAQQLEVKGGAGTLKELIGSEDMIMA